MTTSPRIRIRHLLTLSCVKLHLNMYLMTFFNEQRIHVNGHSTLKMMCDEPYLKLQKLQNSKNQKSEDKNSQSEKLKKKSLRLHNQDSVEQTRPNCECLLNQC